ncbi:MAG: hypothetical protein F6K24_34375, partial [Okeania sp. SIO2D1]|nr:hypothetical protein [Okeania sp. SIO2D1]
MNKVTFPTAIAASISTILATIGAAPADALQVFTDRDAWLEALSGKSFMTETFDNFIPGASVTQFDGGIISEGVEGDNGINNVLKGFYVGAVDSDEDFEKPFSEAYNEITWTFPKPVWAIGGSERSES